MDSGPYDATTSLAGPLGEVPGTSEVGTALSSIALEPYMLVCVFTHQLFVNDAFVY